MFSLDIFSTAVNAISGYFQRKAEARRAKEDHVNTLALIERTGELEAERLKNSARIESIKNGQEQDFDLDRAALAQMDKSLKDELLLIVFLFPMVMAFIPGLDEHALRGFEVIGKMPLWYISIVLGMVIVIYGLRNLFKHYTNARNGSRILIRDNKTKQLKEEHESF